MGGHSHWKGIKEKKGKLDKQRGKLFAKLLRAIEISARQGDPSPDNNPTLADAIQRARDASVPKDNIERAIKRASGGTGGANYERVLYEGYAAGGVAVLAEALTDNRNRTSQDLRSIFSRYGGSLGEPGSVQWLFDKRGVVIVPKREGSGEDDVLAAALDSGADDVRDAGDGWEIVCEPQAFEPVKGALSAAGVEIESAEVTMYPQTTVPVEDAEARGVLRLIEALDELEDVQAVWSNFDIPDSVLTDV